MGNPFQAVCEERNHSKSMSDGYGLFAEHILDTKLKFRYERSADMNFAPPMSRPG